jgi:hypothetical protein
MSTRSHLKRAASQHLNVKQPQQGSRPIPSINGSRNLAGLHNHQQPQPRQSNSYAQHQQHQQHQPRQSNPYAQHQQHHQQYFQQHEQSSLNNQPQQQQQQHPNYQQSYVEPNQRAMYQQHDQSRQPDLNNQQHHNYQQSYAEQNQRPTNHQPHDQYKQNIQPYAQSQTNQPVKIKQKISVSDAINRLSLRLGFIETKVCNNDGEMLQSLDLETQTLLNNLVQRIDGLEKQLKHKCDGCSKQCEPHTTVELINDTESIDKDVIEQIEIVIENEPDVTLEHTDVKLNDYVDSTSD